IGLDTKMHKGEPGGGGAPAREVTWVLAEQMTICQWYSGRITTEAFRMEEQRRLGRDVFIALAAIGWADGKLDSEEADAIVRTALEEGLAIDEISEIE